MENAPHYWPFVRGIHQSPVDSHHNTRVMQNCGCISVITIRRWLGLDTVVLSVNSIWIFIGKNTEINIIIMEINIKVFGVYWRSVHEWTIVLLAKQFQGVRWPSQLLKTCMYFVPILLRGRRLSSIYTHQGWAWDSGMNYIDGLVQERRNSSALTKELHLSHSSPSICPHVFYVS